MTNRSEYHKEYQKKWRKTAKRKKYLREYYLKRKLGSQSAHKSRPEATFGLDRANKPITSARVQAFIKLATDYFELDTNKVWKKGVLESTYREKLSELGVSFRKEVFAFGLSDHKQAIYDQLPEEVRVRYEGSLK